MSSHTSTQFVWFRITMYETCRQCHKFFQKFIVWMNTCLETSFCQEFEEVFLQISSNMGLVDWWLQWLHYDYINDYINDYNHYMLIDVEHDVKCTRCRRLDNVAFIVDNLWLTTLIYYCCVICVTAMNYCVKLSRDFFTRLCSLKCVYCMTLWCHWQSAKWYSFLLAIKHSKYFLYELFTVSAKIFMIFINSYVLLKLS